MAKSRGRDGTISSSRTAPPTTRLMGLTYPAVSTPTLSFVTPALTRTILTTPFIDNSGVYPAPARRMAAAPTRAVKLYSGTASATSQKSVCKNRGIRREVLFAQGKGGRNGMKTARFTRNSKVKC